MIRNLFITGLLFIISVFTLSAQNYQEVVYLKNGSVIRGTVIEQQPNDFIESKNGRWQYLCLPDE